MAITRTQIARQLYKRGTGLGGASRGRQDTESQYGGGSYDPSSNRSGREVGGGRGRDPMAQYSPSNAAVARQMIDSQETIGLGDSLGIPAFFPTVRGILNLKQVKKKTPIDIMRAGLRESLKPEDRFTPEKDDDSQILYPTFSNTIQQPVVEEEKLSELQQLIKDIEPRRFRAEGGIMGGLADGSIDEMGRQMYGLGKLVKKATRAVKKVAKSPIGKAALGYALTGGLGNLAQGQRFFTNFASPTSFLGGAKNIFSGEGLKNIAFGKAPTLYDVPGTSRMFTADAGTSGLFGTGGELSIGKAVTAASILPLLGIGTGDESEEEAQRLIDNSGIDPAAIREAYLSSNQYRARRFRAEGGSMKEPVAKKTMPLLDMDGKEMDLRAEGGFVPIGRMEKADDVPARLSKNEFVFTADAVRNAGDGNVDKGAEVMYNMMKNLESGGDVSEESQGLEGARDMFQTSQRLEEVL